MRNFYCAVIYVYIENSYTSVFFLLYVSFFIERSFTQVGRSASKYFTNFWILFVFG